MAVLLASCVSWVGLGLIELHLSLQLLLVEVLVLLELSQLMRDLLYVLICLVKQAVEEIHLSFHGSIGSLLLHVHL